MLGDLYEQFETRLRRFALGLTRDADRAEDLVQEAFTRAIVHQQTLEGLNKHQQQAWLYRTVRNVFIDEQRKYQRGRIVIEVLAEYVDEDAFNPVDVLPTDLLDSVPAKDRELLERRYVDGSNSTEIGQDLGISAATVRSRLRLALNRIRKTLPPLS